VTPEPIPSQNASPSRRAVLQQLADWRAAGLTHLPRAAPRTPPADTPRVVNATASVPTPADPGPSEKAYRLFDSTSANDSTGASSLSREERQQQLCALAAKVAECTRCAELAKARTQTVFGVGNPEARVMFIGEAPGADEDAQGEPFVGKAGQLLNKIIAACGWQREEVYICNILRCRPPGNRTPLPKEAENCREWLDGQITTIDPEYIVCWGSCAAQNLLGTTDAIGRMRQRWYQYGRAKVLCTYHPSYLLRNPAAKKPVWEDMQFLLKEMGLEPPRT
jgi:DNA polymerase